MSPAMRSRSSPGGFSGVRVQGHGQLRDGFFVVFAVAAHIADPGWEIGHGNKLFAQPCEIRDEAQAHHTGLAYITRDLQVPFSHGKNPEACESDESFRLSRSTKR